MKIISWIKTFFLFGTMLSSSGNLFSQDGYNLYVSDLDNSQVFVFETNAPYTSTVIDLQTVHQLGGVGVTPAQTETYVGFQNNGTVSDEGIAVITNSATPSETYLNIDIFPHGFALTPDGTRFYITTTSNRVVAFDIATQTVITTIATTASTNGIASTPDGTRIYVSTNNGVVLVVDADPTSGSYNTVIDTISSGLFGILNAIAITPDGTKAYVPCYQGDGLVFVIDTNPSSGTYNTVIDTVDISSTGGNPNGVCITTTVNGVYAYVCNLSGDSVCVMDTSNNTIVTTINLGTSLESSTESIVATPDGTNVFVGGFNPVTSVGGGTVAVLDTSNNTYVTTLIGPSNVAGMGIGVPTPIPPPTPSPLPPSNLTGQLQRVSFLIQTEYIHHLQWSPSPDATVVGYILSRNGTQIAQIAASGPYEYNDQNRRKNESDTYSLVSVNGSGIQSTAITLQFQ